MARVTPRTASTPPERESLECRQVPVRLGPGPLRLTVDRGRVWLTVEGEPADHVLPAGMAFILDAGQQAWVSSEQGVSSVTLIRRERETFRLRSDAATPARRR